MIGTNAFSISIIPLGGRGGYTVHFCGLYSGIQSIEWTVYWRSSQQTALLFTDFTVHHSAAAVPQGAEDPWSHNKFPQRLQMLLCILHQLGDVESPGEVI